MDVPPRARSPGAFLDGSGALAATGLETAGVAAMVRDSNADDARLFGFESELEVNLTYIPMAVRFKLDKCGIKLSLAEWQRLPQSWRRDLLQRRCDDACAVADYRRILCSLVRECVGTEPAAIVTAEHPRWSDAEIPEEVVIAAAAKGVPLPSAARWRALTALERFALLKLSRKGHDHRNLELALREFGLL